MIEKHYAAHIKNTLMPPYLLYVLQASEGVVAEKEIAKPIIALEEFFRAAISMSGWWNW